MSLENFGTAIERGAARTDVINEENWSSLDSMVLPTREEPTDICQADFPIFGGGLRRRTALSHQDFVSPFHLVAIGQLFCKNAGLIEPSPVEAIRMKGYGHDQWIVTKNAVRLIYIEKSDVLGENPSQRQSDLGNKFILVCFNQPFHQWVVEISGDKELVDCRGTPA